MFDPCNFCIAYNLISTMNHFSKSEDKNTGVVNIINSNTIKCLVKLLPTHSKKREDM